MRRLWCSFPRFKFSPIGGLGESPGSVCIFLDKAPHGSALLFGAIERLIRVLDEVLRLYQENWY